MLIPATKKSLKTCTIDFRKSYHGLCALVKELFEEDPLGGAMFIFYNRSGNRLKILIAPLWNGLVFGVKISMYGKGRALDQIQIERFWRTVRYEFRYYQTHNISVSTV